ncbi:MAG: hypothetical protein JNL64_04235 [Blastocatellia bacterium]|nr:hypothetical protein [Blastocatellia bacterium]
MDTIFCKTSPTAARPKPLRVKLLETPPDRRRAFVETVLDSIIESRFGPGCVLAEVVSFDEIFEPEREIQFDLTAVRHAHCPSPHVSEGVTQKSGVSAAAVNVSDSGTARADGRGRSHCVAPNALTPKTRCGLVPSNHSPPNLGRNFFGSPPYHGGVAAASADGVVL